MIFESHKDFILSFFFFWDEISIYIHQVIEIHCALPWLAIELDQSP